MSSHAWHAMFVTGCVALLTRQCQIIPVHDNSCVARVMSHSVEGLLAELLLRHLLLQLLAQAAPKLPRRL